MLATFALLHFALGVAVGITLALGVLLGCALRRFRTLDDLLAELDAERRREP